MFGDDRFDTAVEVSERFFNERAVVGLARSHKFPDSLSGGVHIGALGGPMLLTPSPEISSEDLRAQTEAYVCRQHTSITTGYVDGGILAVSDDTRDVFADRIRGVGC